MSIVGITESLSAEINLVHGQQERHTLCAKLQALSRYHTAQKLEWHPHTQVSFYHSAPCQRKGNKEVLLCHTSTSETQFSGTLVAIPVEYFLSLPFLLLLDVPCLTHTYVVALNAIANPWSRIGLQHWKLVMPLTIIIQTDSCISVHIPRHYAPFERGSHHVSIIPMQKSHKIKHLPVFSDSTYEQTLFSPESDVSTLLVLTFQNAHIWR